MLIKASMEEGHAKEGQFPELGLTFSVHVSAMNFESLKSQHLACNLRVCVCVHLTFFHSISLFHELRKHLFFIHLYQI